MSGLSAQNTLAKWFNAKSDTPGPISPTTQNTLMDFLDIQEP